MRGKPTKQGRSQEWGDPSALRVCGIHPLQVLRGSNYTGFELPVGLEPFHTHHWLNVMTTNTPDFSGVSNRHRNSERLVKQMPHKV